MQVRVEQISHTYTQNRGCARPAVKNIDLEISSGEFVCLLGPSGCGKSTLLRILAGLLEPTAGKVSLDGKTPAQVLAAKQIGWLAQSPALLPWRTIEQNVALAQTINPQNGRTLLSPQQLLSLVRLEAYAHAYPAALSGGMQHRAALARTIALGARLWLMDEPFAALDEFTRAALADELIEIWDTFRTTVVWVTHNVYEAVRLADRVLVMSPSPGSIQAQIAIPMPRPRPESTPQFMACVQQVRSAADSGIPTRNGSYAKELLRRL